MEERAACALLKQRFEAAGFTIEDNRPFDEDGIRFEIDGFDAQHRVGYEYATEEAGDSWDVDDAVISALEERRQRGEVHILIIREADAPDAASLGTAADAFLAELRERGVGAAAVAPENEPAPLEPAPLEPAPLEPAPLEPAHPQPTNVEPAQTVAAHPEPAQLEKPPVESAPAEAAGSSGKSRAKASSASASAKKASKAKAPAKPKTAKKKGPRK